MTTLSNDTLQALPTRSHAILIEGAYGESNLGDDALMVSFYNLFREIAPSYKLVFSVRSSAHYPAQLIPNAEILRNTVVSNYAVDILVFGGGTQFYSFRYSDKALENLRKLIANISLKKVWGKLRKIAGVLLGVDRRISDCRLTIAAGIGVGPFEKGKLRAAKRILQTCTYVSVRDMQSASYCMKMGVSTMLGADICYIKEYWLNKDIQIQLCKPRAHAKRVGVVVRDWVHRINGTEYLFPLHAAVKKMRASGIDVEYILFSQTEDAICRDFLNANGERPVEWNPADNTIENFAVKLASYDLVVSARYHGIVLPAALGVPGMAINIEPKLEILADTLENAIGLWSPPFLSDDLVSAATRILLDNTDAITKILDAVEKQRNNALKMVRELRTYIYPNSNKVE